MSEHLRQSPRPIVTSVSPGRPSPLSRPHWPWSTYTHRASSSSISVHSSNSSTLGSQPWDTRASAVSSPSTVLLSTSPAAVSRNAGSLSTSYQNNMHDEVTTRQWSFNAFEWIIRDVSRLKEFVESPAPVDNDAAADVNEALGSEADEFEVLRESPMLDGKFKLEIVKASNLELSEGADTPTPRTQTQSLALYITALMIDFANADYELSASMFAGIKCQDDRVGERGARVRWAWENWQDGWTFRQGSEVWECHLPSLATLLENPRIKETDSFVLCVQMHCPIGPFFPQQPSASYVPQDLLEGLEASLDNPNTGDVQFVCLERMNAQQDSVDPPDSPNTATPHSRRSSSSQSSSVPQTLARKRIIYAHSDILVRRSEYFATMLNSSFSESSNSGVLLPGERKVYTVVVEEADFVTIYWLLKWVYANWLLFRKEDDPREAVDDIGAGWSARGLGKDEWEWKVSAKGVPSGSQSGGGLSDAHSVASGESARSSSGGDKGKQTRVASQSQTTPSMRTSHPGGSVSSKHPPSTASIRSPQQIRRPTNSSTSGNTPALTVPMTNASSPSAPRGPKPVPIPLSPSTTNFSPPAHYPLSPHQRQRNPAVSTTDPHAHPTPAPPPASALSMYQVAHRYSIPGLASLALEHIMTTLTPQSSFGILLATSTWDELHSLVEDYVVEKWEEVSISEEFEQCCQEVASGDWGPEGGKTLAALFRRLRSPNMTSYTRS